MPSNLLVECKLPELDEVGTAGDLERVAQAALTAAVCGNDDKAAIRAWQAKEVSE